VGGSVGQVDEDDVERGAVGEQVDWPVAAGSGDVGFEILRLEAALAGNAREAFVLGLQRELGCQLLSEVVAVARARRLGRDGELDEQVDDALLAPQEQVALVG
jgi:hypothetical protein